MATWWEIPPCSYEERGFVTCIRVSKKKGRTPEYFLNTCARECAQIGTIHE